ncbi:MAG: AraC family transcriptional regulator [Polaribacter sp.]|uniref:helix-turn-helix domain-containing protein n=1 Tax=Polaribacter sp. TaxID=1920175 RepID=UPI0032630BBD
MEEIFITRKPVNLFLQKYISYYYFHDSIKGSTAKKYAFYPNTKCALTIYKDSDVEFSSNHSKTVPSEKKELIFLYSGIQNKMRTAEIQVPFKKIGIVFQELGINHFIDQPLSEIMDNPIEKHFNFFKNDFTKNCFTIYNEKSIDEKIKILDAFFMDKYVDFKEILLKQSIELILNSNQKLSIIDLCEQLKTNRKTLLRLFKKHLCCTTKEYINIVQFRKALNDYLLINKKTSLTNIAISNEYYDQAQFINHFKKLTGINPKKFFNNIQHLGNEDTFWTFM